MTVAGKSLTKTESPSGSAYASFKETIADGQTDKQVTLAVDVSATKMFYIVSDQDITLETNSGSTPDDTISLKAGKPYVFVDADYNSFLLGTDVTALFFTNASGSSATVECHVITDATP